MKRKLEINWKIALLFLFVVGGIYFIMSALLRLTHPFLATLGILLLLFVGDAFAREADYRLKIKRRDRERSKREGGEA